MAVESLVSVEHLSTIGRADKHSERRKDVNAKAEREDMTLQIQINQIEIINEASMDLLTHDNTHMFCAQDLKLHEIENLSSVKRDVVFERYISNIYIHCSKN